jgi:hypothetical protein
VQNHIVNAGLQPGNPNRAEWNFNYVINTAAGIAPGSTFDLTNTPGLAAYDFKMQITRSGPQFLHPHTAVFGLNAASHVWIDESNPLIGFARARSFKVDLTSNVNRPLKYSVPEHDGFNLNRSCSKAEPGDLLTVMHDHITLVAPI